MKLRNKVEWSIEASFTVHVLSRRRNRAIVSNRLMTQKMYKYSPILPLKDNMNFTNIVAVDFLVLGRVKAAEAHRPHHLDLFGRLALEIGFGDVNSFGNLGF